MNTQTIFNESRKSWRFAKTSGYIVSLRSTRGSDSRLSAVFIKETQQGLNYLYN